MTTLKFGDKSGGSFGFRSLSTTGSSSTSQWRTRVSEDNGSVSILATPQTSPLKSNDSAVSVNLSSYLQPTLDRLRQSTAENNATTDDLEAALQDKGVSPKITESTLQEADAKAAMRAEPLGEFWDRGVSALGDIVGQQIDTLTTLADEQLTTEQRAALETEFSALGQEYDRVYTVLTGESRRSWVTPSGFNVPFASGISYASVEVTSEMLLLLAGSGTPITLATTVTPTSTALSTAPEAVLDATGAVSSTNDTLNLVGHGLTVGNRVRLELAGSAPGGLAEGTDYYAIIVDSDTIKLATSAVNAAAGTAIDITSTGSGAIRVLTGVTDGFDVSATYDSLQIDTGITGTTTTRVNTDSAGNQTANGTTGNLAVISGDGRYVIFASDASNLVAGDTNGVTDIFMKDLVSGTTTRISTDSSDAQVYGASNSVGIQVSANGRYVLFASSASTLVAGDTNSIQDIFMKDTVTGTVTRVNTTSSGSESVGEGFASAISSDGRYVLFDSDASDLIAGDTNGYRDIFRKDLVTGTVTLVTADSSGVQGTGSFAAGMDISDDGNYALFTSSSSNLVAGDTNSDWDIFRKDLTTGTVTRVNTDSAGNETSSFYYTLAAKMSADGRYIAFNSEASNLVAGDANGISRDVFLKDMVTGTTTLLSTSSSGTQGNGESTISGTSADGRYVLFQSTSTNLVLGDTNGRRDVFIKDTQTGITIRVSTDSTGAEQNNLSSGARISDDGTKVVFYSTASNLVSGDTNTAGDLFVKEVVDAQPFNSTTNEVTLAGTSLTTGTRIRFSGSGTLPTGLSEDTDYYIIDTGTPDQYRIATTAANAGANTFIDFSGSATGFMSAEYNYTVSPVANSITIASHGLSTGARLRIASAGSLPGGVTEYTDYYAIVDDTDTIRLATSEVNAAGGTAVDITSSPSATLLITVLGSGGINAFNPVTDEITKTAHGLATGERIQFTGAGTAPAGLSKDTDYYVIQGGDANTFKVATSYANALASTAINFSGTASGAISLVSYTTETDFDPATDTVTATGSNLTTGQRIQFSDRDGVLATGLTAGVDYYAIRINNDEFKVASSLANAMAVTAIDFTSTGSGTTYVTGLSGASAFDLSTNAITVATNNLTTGQAVTLSSTSAGLGYLPTGLSNGTYYVIKDSPTSIRLATSAANAAAGTAVDFTSNGSLGAYLEAYSETSTTRTGDQPLFNVTSTEGRLSASATLANLESSISVALRIATTGNSRTKSLAAYSRAKSG